MDGPRACDLSEFDEIVALINRVFRSGSDQDVRTDYPFIFNPSNKNMRIVKVDGKVVAHVPVWPRRVITNSDAFGMGIIGGTVTHPDYRRRGYATQCLRDCVRIMESNSLPASVLWTMEATFPFYQNSGWEAVGSQGWVYWLKLEDGRLFENSSHKIVPLDLSTSHQLEGIIRIHESEPLRIARSRSEYEVLFSLHKTRTLVALRESQVDSYLMVGYGTNKPGLIEGGGDHRGLEALVAHVLAGWNAKEVIQAVAPLPPSPLGDLLELKKPGTGRPIEEANGVGFQMMRVNDLGLLMQSIPAWLGRKSEGLRGDVSIVCHETKQVVTLHLRDGTVDVTVDSGGGVNDPDHPARQANHKTGQVILTQRELVQLIFGSHEGLNPVAIPEEQGALLHTLFPIEFVIDELDHS